MTVRWLLPCLALAVPPALGAVPPAHTAAPAARVYGFDASAPPQELHRSKSLQEILTLGNAPEEDRRNEGFYMFLNAVAARVHLFYGADASADRWQRNLRMYALIQQEAGPGERVLVIAGSGQTAILRDFLASDSLRVEENILPYLAL